MDVFLAVYAPLLGFIGVAITAAVMFFHYRKADRLTEKRNEVEQTIALNTVLTQARDNYNDLLSKQKEIELALNKRIDGLYGEVDRLRRHNNLLRRQLLDNNLIPVEYPEAKVGR